MSDPERSCFGKRRYYTEGKAHLAATRAYELRGTWCRVYACDVCAGWHLTHQQALPPPGKSWRPPAPSRAEAAFEARAEHRAKRWRRRRA